MFLEYKISPVCIKEFESYAGIVCTRLNSYNFMSCLSSFPKK